MVSKPLRTALLKPLDTISADGSRSDAASSTVDEDTPKAGLHTTGDMARLTGNTLRTVRFYEEAGILRPARRTEGGHRLFDDRELEKLRLVSDMREAGMSLEDVRSLLELKDRAKTGGEAAKTATVALGELLTMLKTKLDVLARLSTDIERTIEQAESCSGCAEVDLFPKRCHECQKLLAKGRIPRGLRVLWGMPADKADRPVNAEEQ